MSKAVFLMDDRYGAYKAGDTCEFLGRETDHPEAPDLYLFDIQGIGVIGLDNAFERGLVTLVGQDDPEPISTLL